MLTSGVPLLSCAVDLATIDPLSMGVLRTYGASYGPLQRPYRPEGTDAVERKNFSATVRLYRGVVWRRPLNGGIETSWLSGRPRANLPTSCCPATAAHASASVLWMTRLGIRFGCERLADG